MEIKDCTDEDLGICIADQNCEQFEAMIKRVGLFLLVTAISAPIIACYLILL